MKKIILIGGSPTAGKSYVARKLSESLKLPWISTDTIREQMKELVRREDYPALFYHAGANSKMAVKFLTENTTEEIVKIQNKESSEVWKGVKAIIETDYVWQSLIMEGVAILPKFVSNLLKKNKTIKPIFLINDNIEDVRKIIFTRGLWDDAHKYPNSVKEKEVEWVFAFNRYIKTETKKYKLPLIFIDKRENYLDEIKRLIK